MGETGSAPLLAILVPQRRLNGVSRLGGLQIKKKIKKNIYMYLSSVNEIKTTWRALSALKKQIAPRDLVPRDYCAAYRGGNTTVTVKNI